MRKVKMTWPEMDIAVEFELEDERNRELCDEFWNELPLVAVQEHGTVSGELFYCWVNMLSFAKVPFSQLHSESPIGRVSYSQGTGNKIIVKYGPVSEDCYAPALGLVPEKYHKDIQRVGKTIWDNYYMDKKVYTVKFEKGEE